MSNKLLLLVTIFSLTSHDAITADDFYKGKTVNIIVGFSPGGGYDTYGRLVSRHLGAFLPGNPTPVVQNMPGAGQIIASNWLATSAERDGSVIGFTERALPYLRLMGDQNIRFDPRKLNWIGSISRDLRVCYAWHQAEVQSWDDLVKGKTFNENDWVVFRPSDGWSITVNGVLCRILEDINVRGRIQHPDQVW